MRIRIVPLDRDDIPFAKSLTDAEGWARSRRAWERFFRVQPDGFYQAVDHGTPGGIVGIFCYARVAWIHSLIVVPGYRRKGVGRRLVGFCREEATRRGIRALKLDAAPGTTAFYERLGWRSEFPSRRFHGTSGRMPHRCHSVRGDEIESLLRVDQATLGWDRSRLLRELAQDQPDGTFAVGSTGNPEGYVFSVPAEGRVEIGPLVVSSRRVDVARELLRATLDRWSGQTVRCCVPGTHPAAGALMAEFGFEEEAPSTRMALGDEFPEATAQFLMAGPAEG